MAVPPVAHITPGPATPLVEEPPAPACASAPPEPAEGEPAAGAPPLADEAVPPAAPPFPAPPPALPLLAAVAPAVLLCAPPVPARAVGAVALLPPLAAGVVDREPAIGLVALLPAAGFCGVTMSVEVFVCSPPVSPLSAAEQPGRKRVVSAAVAGTMHALSVSRRDKMRRFFRFLVMLSRGRERFEGVGMGRMLLSPTPRAALVRYG